MHRCTFEQTFETKASETSTYMVIPTLCRLSTAHLIAHYSIFVIDRRLAAFHHPNDRSILGACYFDILRASGSTVGRVYKIRKGTMIHARKRQTPDRRQSKALNIVALMYAPDPQEPYHSFTSQAVKRYLIPFLGFKTGTSSLASITPALPSAAM